jgi:hypothetical protein
MYKNLKDIQPIEGFKVMEWVRQIREKEYKLYKSDPQTYFRELKEAGQSMRTRLGKT